MTDRLLARARAHAGKLLVGLLLLSGLAFAGINLEAYSEIHTAPTVFTVSSPETKAKDTPIRPRVANGNPSIYVQPTFSVSGATATLEVDVYRRISGTNTWQATTAIWSLTASTTRTADSGRYTLDRGVLCTDTGCLPIYDVRCTAISSGNVKWVAWVGAADTAPAGGTDNQ